MMKKWMAILMVLVFASISQGQGIIDKWDFNTGTTLETCPSTSEIGGGGLFWGAEDTVVTIDSQTMYFEKTWEDKGYFKKITPSGDWGGASGNGIIEIEVDFSDADWSNSKAAGDYSTYMSAGLRSGDNTDIFARIMYQGELNTTNVTTSGATNIYANADHIALMFTQPDGPQIEIKTYPGATYSSNLHVRITCDLGNGTTKYYYTEEGGSEILAYEGTIPAGWTIKEYKFSSQLKDKKPTYWGIGDSIRIDNLTYTEILPPVPPPAFALVDLWEFEGLTNGAAFSEAASTGYVGNVKFKDSAILSITNLVGNGALRITADPLGVETNTFPTATPSLYAGSTTGIYEVVMDVLSVDFTKTSLVDSDGNFAFEVRDTAKNEMGMEIEYDGDNDQIEIGFEDATGEFVSKTIPGHVAENIQLRMLIDLDNAGTAGSAQFFYTTGGVEVGKYDGTLYSGFDFAQYRLRVAASVKGWQSGDVTLIDNLKIEKVASLESAPVFVDIVDYQMNDGSGTLLNALSQTGTDAGQFQGTDSFIATDGSGRLVFNPVTDGVTRKHFLGTTFTEGLNRLEFALDDWNLDATTDASGIKFALVDNTGTNQVSFGIDVNTNNATVRFRAAADGGDAGQDTSYGSYVASTGVVLRIEVNLDAGSYSASWKFDNGGEFVGIVSGGSLGLMDNISEVRLAVADTGWDAADFVNVDYLVFSSSSDEAPWTPDSRYAAWVDAYPTLGASTNMTDNPDGDPLNNLYEYALGGSPVDGSDVGNKATSQTLEDGGANYLEYVYAERTDNVTANRGLTYFLETTTDLIIVPWENANYVELGTGIEAFAPGFNAVTNRISTDVKSKQFIRLQVEFTP